MAWCSSLAAQAVLLALLGTTMLGVGFIAGSSGGSMGQTALRGAALDGGNTSGTGATAVPSQPDFNPAGLRDATIKRLRNVTRIAESRPLSSLAADDGLRVHASDASALHVATGEMLSELASSFDPDKHEKLIRGLQLLGVADDWVNDALQAMLPLAADHLSGGGAQLPGEAPPIPQGKPTKTMQLSITVSQRPFGMQIKGGTTQVKDVFPGLPAKAAGVRKGCQVNEVAGHSVASGTWLDAFQKSPLPFELKLTCGGDLDSIGNGPLADEDLHLLRVMVAKKPFGMNIQVNKLPRVVEVLPGFPAEAAGIRRGHVLVRVNDKPVDASNWFEEYQGAQIPFTMTLDTAVPLHADNPFFKAPKRDEGSNDQHRSGEHAEGEPDAEPEEHDEKLDEKMLAALDAMDNMTDFAESLEDGVPEEHEEEPVPTTGYTDFRCSVEALPFGMKVNAFPGSRPKVTGVIPGGPADRAGVHSGDVLIEVAGRPVTSGTWFMAMQQSVTPYGLLFRRPTAKTEPATADAASAGAAVAVGGSGSAANAMAAAPAAPAPKRSGVPS